MASIKGTETEKNLLKAFAGESQARMRYDYFSKQAKKEGLVQISEIFMETAINEKEHAKMFFKYLEGGMTEITASYPAGRIGTTEENLKAAAEGENEEWTELYPKFAEIAAEEGFKNIANTFRQIAKVEKEHEARYLKLYNNLKEGKVFERDGIMIWKCIKCGYIHEGKSAPKKCPSCLHGQEYFKIKEENY